MPEFADLCYVSESERVLERALFTGMIELTVGMRRPRAKAWIEDDKLGMIEG